MVNSNTCAKEEVKARERWICTNKQTTKKKNEKELFKQKGWTESKKHLLLCRGQDTFQLCLRRGKKRMEQNEKRYEKETKKEKGRKERKKEEKGEEEIFFLKKIKIKHTP